MSTDPFSTANGAAPSMAPADSQARSEAQHYADLGRQQGQDQQRRANLPSPVAPPVDLAQMVPPEHRSNPQAYLDSMAERGGADPRGHLDSSQIKGALPIDSNILSDIRSPGGFVRNAAAGITPDCTVSYGGTRITVEQAVNQGLIEPDGRGGYQVPNAAERAAKEQQDANAQKAQQEVELRMLRDQGDAPDAETSTLIDQVVSVVPQHSITALVQDIVQNGSISLDSVRQVADSIGMPAAHAEAMVEKTFSGLKRQADQAARAIGVAAEEVDAMWAFAQQRYATEHGKAVLSLALSSDSRGLKELARLYLMHKRDGARR